MQASLCAPPRFVASYNAGISARRRASNHGRSCGRMLAASYFTSSSAVWKSRLKHESVITASAREVLAPLETDGNSPPTTISAPGRRIVAVGDLHGDLTQTKRALRLAGVLSNDDEDEWTGGSTVLVQLGDVLDRGPDEIAIMSLFWHLTERARSKGGAVFQIHGNHETMNLQQEFTDTPESGFEDSQYFVDYCKEKHDGDWHSAFVQWRVAWRNWKEKRPQTQFSSWLSFLNFFKKRNKIDARTMLFSPGGPMAKVLSRHGVVLNVNGWLFAHGGLLPQHVAYGFERMNSQVASWMKGDLAGKQPFVVTKGFDSIVWSRLYSRKFKEIPQVKACAVLDATLKAANAKGLIVGHTPQKVGANSECEGRVWRIDVGMSHGVLGAEPQVLEIVGDTPKVLSC